MRSAALSEGRRSSRRQYFRVGTRLPIRHRRLAAEEVESCCLEVEAAGRNADGVDGPLGAHLLRLEAKLDELLALAGARPPAPFERRSVEISGAGLRMADGDPPPVGSALWLEFRLPGVAWPVRAVGTVRRHAAPPTPGASPEIAVAFRAIRDVDRQAIVSFALEAERCRLRAGREPRIAG